MRSSLAYYARSSVVIYLLPPPSSGRREKQQAANAGIQFRERKRIKQQLREEEVYGGLMKSNGGFSRKGKKKEKAEEASALCPRHSWPGHGANFPSKRSSRLAVEEKEGALRGKNSQVNAAAGRTIDLLPPASSCTVEPYLVTRLQTSGFRFALRHSNDIN